jgi:thiol:disulfide interchange protein
LASVAAILAVLIIQYPKSKPMGNVGVAQLMGGLLVFLLALGWLPYQNAEGSKWEVRLVLGEPFSETRLATLRAEGKPVFVYFTADWCVTCKVNEAAVLERSETMKLFADKGVTVLRGDFTRRDPAIARFLSQHGHAGVPLYLYYPKGGEGRILPQLLTYGIIEDAAGG